MDNKKQVFNPYLPSWEYIPDGEPYVYGDRVYVYGSHDFYNGHVFCHTEEGADSAAGGTIVPSASSITPFRQSPLKKSGAT